MALTVLDAQGHIEHALGGPLVGISNRRVLDEAGRNLYGLADWNFLKRPSTTLDFTASQSYITLPDEFGEIVTIEYTSGSSNRVMQTTLSEIARYRSVLAAIPGYILFVAINYELDSNDVPVPRLEIHPTPQTTTSTGVLTMMYRAGWQDLANSDQTFIPVPPWMESLYIQVVRATAWGYQNEDMGARLAQVMQSPIWTAAIQYDRKLQWSHGPLKNGALETANVDDGVWYLRNAALPPAAG
jgi:hypothetical protein